MFSFFFYYCYIILFFCSFDRNPSFCVYLCVFLSLSLLCFFLDDIEIGFCLFALYLLEVYELSYPLIIEKLI